MRIKIYFILYAISLSSINIADPVLTILDFHSKSSNEICHVKTELIRKKLGIKVTREVINQDRYRLETNEGDLLIICHNDYVLTTIASATSSTNQLEKFVNALKKNFETKIKIQ